MLLRVYIQALHSSCIAITSWPDLIGQKETHSRWSIWKNLLVKQMEWERVEWMDFNSVEHRSEHSLTMACVDVVTV